MSSDASAPGQPPAPVFVLLYESADNVAAKAPPVFPAHKARLDEFHGRGELLMVGTFGDPQAEGSMAIFRSRKGAEEFVADDPFVLGGVVKSWQIRQWNEALGGLR
ncbi:MAG: YciI family protein [Streptosporangiaceae bacterium]